MKIQNFFIPVDFVVLDMEVDAKTPLILSKPFLSTANAHINVGAGEIQLNINGHQEKFAFKPKVEQCSLVKEAHRKKKHEKEAKKPSLPNIEALIEFGKSADSGGATTSRGSKANQASQSEECQTSNPA